MLFGIKSFFLVYIEGEVSLFPALSNRILDTSEENEYLSQKTIKNPAIQAKNEDA